MAAVVGRLIGTPQGRPLGSNSDLSCRPTQVVIKANRSAGESVHGGISKPCDSVQDMTRRVFEEPAVPRATPLSAAEPRVSWFLESTRSEAVEGRRLVNDLYAQFPDRDGALYVALHSPDERRLLPALDELLIHDLINRRYHVTYEEDEGTRLDFRLYDGPDYIGAVEVASLMLRQDWSAEQKRHAQLAEALNKRLPVTTHFLDFEVRRWESAPITRHLEQWIRSTLQDLQANPEALSVGDVGVPEKVYSSKTAELVFSFHPVPDAYQVKDDDRLVSDGAGIGGFVDSDIRLRGKLHDKAAKYDLRGKPYAIVIGVHDPMCDLDDIFDALIGTAAIVVATGQDVRKGDGFYGRSSRVKPAGKHTRVSCVYAIQDWWPGGLYQPRITRFDNPFAASEFPLDCLPIDAHWAEVDRGPTYVRSDWRIPPVPPKVAGSGFVRIDGDPNWRGNRIGSRHTPG
jgi:hypothetical protein